MDEIQITELHDLEVERQDGVANPASGFKFLVTKAVAPELDQDGDGSNDMDDQGIFEDGSSSCGCCPNCNVGMAKAKLTAAERDKLPDSDFAGPDRSYPIHDENHARAALSEVAQHGTPEEKARVRAAVKRRYPGIDVEKEYPMDDNAQPVETEEVVTPETSEEPEVTKAEDTPAFLTADEAQELIKAALETRDSEAESIRKELAETKSELEVLKATPIPGGPVITATADQRALKAKSEAVEKAAYYKRLARTVQDRELAIEYMKRSDAFAAQAA